MKDLYGQAWRGPDYSAFWRNSLALPLLSAYPEPRGPGPQGEACAHIFLCAHRRPYFCVTYRFQFIKLPSIYTSYWCFLKDPIGSLRKKYLWYLTYVRSKIWLLTQNKYSYSKRDGATLLVFEEGDLAVPTKLDHAATFVPLTLLSPMRSSSVRSAIVFVSWVLDFELVVTVKTLRVFF